MINLKYCLFILLSFILLSCSSFPDDGLRRNKFYTNDGKYNGYSMCSEDGCQFYDKYNNYQGYHEFKK